VKALTQEHEDYEWLDAATTNARIKVEGALGSAFTPHCARVQPAALARGLARKVEELGVKLFENSAVSQLDGRVARTDGGSLTGKVLVRATEGYTSAPSLCPRVSGTRSAGRGGRRSRTVGTS
jgi:glycine/D-amino acid oxidase-like deaminating enzyme